jgi:hypothetical protein
MTCYVCTIKLKKPLNLLPMIDVVIACSKHPAFISFHAVEDCN